MILITKTVDGVVTQKCGLLSNPSCIVQDRGRVTNIDAATTVVPFSLQKTDYVCDATIPGQTQVGVWPARKSGVCHGDVPPLRVAGTSKDVAPHQRLSDRNHSKGDLDSMLICACGRRNH